MGKVERNIIEDKYFEHMLQRIEFKLIEEDMVDVLNEYTKRYLANCNMFIKDIDKIIDDIKKYINNKKDDNVTLYELKNILVAYDIKCN